MNQRLTQGMNAVSLLLIVLAGVLTFGGPAEARITEEQLQTQNTPEMANGIVDFLNTYHNVGKLILHVSNRGIFGTSGNGQLANSPSAQWPPGATQDYLFAAGLWVGGVTDDNDTLVSAAVYQSEMWPDFFNPLETMYNTWEGRPGGLRNTDDDGDGQIDEDEIDGVNNDPWNDTRIDEDHGAISQQMFRCTYYDTTNF
ncbi:MAG: hypothetical protein HKN20_17340, partial [Gemmatimonadetes bacterium]|nr:hypothetical protein [Gemmatimonadota bacterium]